MRTLTSLLSLASLSLLTAVAAGCSAAPGDEADAFEDEVTVSQARAALDVHPLDIWAQPLVLSQLKMTVTRNGAKVTVKPAETTTIFLGKAGTYTIKLEAPQHEPLIIVVRYDGGTADSSAVLDPTGTVGAYSFGHTRLRFSGRSLEAHELYLGLRHKWFSAEGRPARHGNSVRFMMDGEEAWSTVKKDLDRASSSVMASTWWWESDFELVRSPIGTPSEQRWQNTILGTLEGNKATKRVLVGEFYGQDTLLQLLNTDSKLRARASAPGDHFEMMGQANETRGKFRFEIPTRAFGDRVKNAFKDAPRLERDSNIVSPVPAHDVDLTKMLNVDLPLASYHQKFMVVDDEVAFVGGMNLRYVDWDSSKHEIYDARRMKFGAWDMTRTSVAEKSRTPDGGPRKDYMVRIDGPAAQDVADVFHERWEFLRGIKAKYSDQSSSFEVKRNIAPRAGGIDLQVTATLPSPFLEHAIAETWFNAINHAEKFIYIEDQYFRMPMIHDALLKRMDDVAGLQLVVITKPVGTWTPECLHSYQANELFRTRYPSRFVSLQLRAFEPSTREFADMDVHSKMLIVDDVFMSVGSANKNNRGMVYEGELNVAVADPVVGTWRKRIVDNLLGGAPAGDDWIAALRAAAKKNDAGYANPSSAAPVGFAYGLVMGAPSTCKMQSVGPDQT